MPLCRICYNATSSFRTLFDITIPLPFRVLTHDRYKHKDLYLVSLVNDAIGHSVIIFTRTVNEAQRVGILLRTLGFSAIPLHGQLSQST